MKKVLLFLLVFVSLSTAAQDEVVKNVCDVEFGDSFNVAKGKLKQYFEKRKSASKFAALSNEHWVMEMPELSTIQYKYEYYEGIAFDNLYFKFENNGGFSYASFWIYSENKKEAKELFEEVADKLRLKYTLYEGSDEDGNFIGYGGGINYKDPNKCAFLLKIYNNTDIVLSISDNGF